VTITGTDVINEFTFQQTSNVQAGAIDGSLILNLPAVSTITMQFSIIDSDAPTARTWITSTPYVGMVGYGNTDLGVKASRPIRLINLGYA